jgi:hypothetical protein
MDDHARSLSESVARAASAGPRPVGPDVADRIGSTAVSDHSCDAARYALCAEAIPPPATQPRNLVFG